MFELYIKYLLEGIAVAVAAYFIPRKKVEMSEIIFIALSAAATFAVLDIFAPKVGDGARKGAGFGIGANTVGWPSGAESFRGGRENFYTANSDGMAATKAIAEAAGNAAKAAAETVVLAAGEAAVKANSKKPAVADTKKPAVADTKKPAVAKKAKAVKEDFSESTVSSVKSTVSSAVSSAVSTVTGTSGTSDTNSTNTTNTTSSGTQSMDSTGSNVIGYDQTQQLASF